MESKNVRFFEIESEYVFVNIYEAISAKKGEE